MAAFHALMLVAMSQGSPGSAASPSGWQAGVMAPRPEEKRWLNRVERQLAHSPSRVAHNTLRLLRVGVVGLDTLDHMSVEDCQALLADHPGFSDDADNRCQPTADGHAIPPRWAFRILVAYTHGTHVYLKAGKTPAYAAHALVHEVNHAVNNPQARQESPDEVLRDEYRAYWLETTFEKGRALSPQECRALKEWIIENYELTGMAPDSIPDVPDGNLDNAMPKERIQPPASDTGHTPVHPGSRSARPR